MNERSIHEEYQYLHLLEHILEHGSWEEGRNGKTKSIFGASMRFSLRNSKIPIITTKKTAWKTCLKELLWFLRGETDTKILQSQGVHIWDANSSREFLDSRGLFSYPEGIIGPGYGHQWRNYDGMYMMKSVDANQTGSSSSVTDGIDQLQSIIHALKDPKERTSRRLVLTAWNPRQLDQMALPPCHILCQFNVHDGNQLSCAMYQRSADLFLGVPFNITSYSILTHLLAVHCGLEPYEFIHFIGNCHLYENAIHASRLQIGRQPLSFPTLTITQTRDRIEDYKVDDFSILHYEHHEEIKVNMVA